MKLNTKAKVILAFEENKEKRFRLRQLYTNAMISCQKRQKSLIFAALFDYCERKRASEEKSEEIIAKLRRFHKARIMQELRSYSIHSIQVRTVTEKARLKRKSKVLSEMRIVCQRRARINDLQA